METSPFHEQQPSPEDQVEQLYDRMWSNAGLISMDVFKVEKLRKAAGEQTESNS
jgi:hypothetical protein